MGMVQIKGICLLATIDLLPPYWAVRLDMFPLPDMGYYETHVQRPISLRQADDPLAWAGLSQAY